MKGIVAAEAQTMPMIITISLTHCEECGVCQRAMDENDEVE